MLYQTYYLDRNRGSPVLQQFFGEAFDGILLHDFWTAYESIDVLDRQYCLAFALKLIDVRCVMLASGRGVAFCVWASGTTLGGQQTPRKFVHVY